MFVIGNLLEAVAAVLNVVLQLLLLVIFVNALLSWVRPDPSNPIVMTLDRISDLLCNPIRRIFPTMVSGIDFAPFIAMLAIWLVQMFLVGTLRDVALRMGVTTRLAVRVQPGARGSALVGWMADGTLKLKVGAPPEDGRANRAVVELLALAVGLKPAAVRVVRGPGSRSKVVEVDGLDEPMLRSRITAALEAAEGDDGR